MADVNWSRCCLSLLELLNCLSKELEREDILVVSPALDHEVLRSFASSVVGRSDLTTWRRGGTAVSFCGCCLGCFPVGLWWGRLCVVLEGDSGLTTCLLSSICCCFVRRIFRCSSSLKTKFVVTFSFWLLVGTALLGVDEAWFLCFNGWVYDLGGLRTPQLMLALTGAVIDCSFGLLYINFYFSRLME